MEYFDLVNEKDEVIGITTREQSHSSGEIHRVVAVYVFTPDGKLYMQEHEKSGGLFDHSIGGHVSKGESYAEAAEREGEEELGLTVPFSHIATFYSDEKGKVRHVRHYFGLYECIVPDSWKFQPTEEVKTLIPKSVEEIVRLMNDQPELFTPGFINTMKEYTKQKQLPYLAQTIHS